MLVRTLMVLGLAGCATAPGPRPPAPGERAESAIEPGSARTGDAASLVAQAEQALVAEDPARAVALFARALEGEPAAVGPAYRGLARAHELLGDYTAAVRAYDAYLAGFSAGPDAADAYARRGACEAELEQWERSADSYRRAHEAGAELPPSFHVEALARRGFALFQLERFEDADVALVEADAAHEAAMQAGSERFSTYYFVGMARFYRAAIVHRRFREISIRLPEAQMAKDFEAKLALLVSAQDAYNHTIAAKHVFWVSASGYQLGSLFEEFYDALMYAPIPDWLDARQRRIYYEELKKQLRPVVDKAIWVFEKNLETAQKLGYESPFIDKTEERLSRLQGVLLSGDSGLGEPHPRIAPPEAFAEFVAPGEPEGGPRPAVERKLFVPIPTPL